MRVLFFLRCLWLGGVERQVFLLADQLTRRGHDPRIAALHVLDSSWRWLAESGSVDAETSYARTPGYALSAASQLAGATLRLRRILKTEAVQLVHSPQGPISYFISWLATRGLSGTGLIWNVTGSRPDSCGQSVDWKEGLLSRVCWLVSPSVPLMISCGHAAYAYAESKGYRCGKHVVIPNGIDIAHFRPDVDGRARVREKWGIGDEETLIGLVGRLVPVKGHAVFLEAIASLCRERLDFRGVCVGSGPEPYPGRLRTLSQQLGLENRLIWAGSRKDMPAVYSALDVLCSPSYSEGFGLVIGEAMACGIPCVVTDVGESARIVDGTALLFHLEIQRRLPAASEAWFVTFPTLINNGFAIRSHSALQPREWLIRRRQPCWTCLLPVSRSPINVGPTLSRSPCEDARFDALESGQAVLETDAGCLTNSRGLLACQAGASPVVRVLPRQGLAAGNGM